MDQAALVVASGEQEAVHERLKIGDWRAFRLNTVMMIAIWRTKQPPEHRFVRETAIFTSKLAISVQKQ
jgi:hypothetical protein